MVLGVVGVALVVGASASLAQTSSSRRVVQVSPQVPRGAVRIGRLPGSSAVTGAVVLKPRDSAALESFIAEVTDANSPQFHHYLPPGAFAGRFGPAQSTIEAVRAALRADGLRVAGVSDDGLMVRFAGSANRVEGAFHTQLERYRLADGSLGEANSSAVTLPGSLAGSVAGVVGLNTLVPEQSLGIVGPVRPGQKQFPAAQTGSFVHPSDSPTPCRDAKADATSIGGLTDDQIANAYGAYGLYGSGDTGAGQHIAVYELEPFLRSDIHTFDACFFGAARAAAMMSRLHVFPVDGGQPAGPGSGEAVLDVEDISALAPGATIDVYEGPSPNANPNVYDALDEYAAIIDADRDTIVSTSWGLCEQAVERGQPGLQEAENYLFEQAAAQGQTVFAAAGDNGSDDCNTFETSSVAKGQNPLSVDDPGSQPYVVGVGGTTITNAASQPAQEQVWNDGADGGGGGGGISTSWEMPAWQQAASVPGIARPGSSVYREANAVEQQHGYRENFCQAELNGVSASTPCRLVPDVSAQADEDTGAITVFSVGFESQQFPNGWVTIGGTSSATPIWAAMTALIDASPTCDDQAVTRGGVGFLSPVLYKVASDPSEYAASFNDIDTGDNDVYGLTGGQTFAATRGYDLASGLGSPRLTGPGGIAGLAYYVCSLGQSASRPVVSSLAPAIGSASGGERIVISGRGFKSGGASGVAAVQIGTRPVSSFTVSSPTSITVTLPPARETLPPSAPAPQDGAGPAMVIVTLRNGESSATGPTTRFQYVDEQPSVGGAIPSVTGVSPDGGLETSTQTVAILGSGFTAATRVTFGGVAAHFRVLSPYRIAATRPRYSSATACSRLPSRGVFKHENARNDICQVQVRVSGPDGTSAVGRILPPLQGALVPNSTGVIKQPAGCHCELGQAPSEFDYLPKPAITSVSTSVGPARLASENGGTLITVHGHGFDPQTIDWATIGDPDSESSIDTSYVYATGTEIQILALPQSVTLGPSRMALRVRTEAGDSAPVAITYAGVPVLDSVVNTKNRVQLYGDYGGPDTGGTPIRLLGRGFANQLLDISFVQTSASSSPSYGTQHAFTVSADGTLTAHTVEQNPALVKVKVCTVTACSSAKPSDLFYLYPPGNSSVSSVTPASGPGAGGTKTVIDGENLGCPFAVDFGGVAAATFATANKLLSCGTTTSVSATSPPGTSGSSVRVTVETLESYFARHGRSPTTAYFTYN